MLLVLWRSNHPTAPHQASPAGWIAVLRLHPGQQVSPAFPSNRHSGDGEKWPTAASDTWRGDPGNRTRRADQL